MPMLIFLANFLFFRCASACADRSACCCRIAGIVLTASHGDPARLLELDVNFGDALMLVGILVYSGYTVALRYKPAIHWQSLMIVLTLRARSSRRCPSLSPSSSSAPAILPDAQAGRSSSIRCSSRRSCRRSSTSAASS